MNTLMLAFNLQTSLQNNHSVDALIADHLEFRDTLSHLGIYDAKAEAQALTDIALQSFAELPSIAHMAIAC